MTLRTDLRNFLPEGIGVEDGDLFSTLYTAQPHSCMFCNGFYGSNLGEFVCPTCHAFLYPEGVDNVVFAAANAQTTDIDAMKSDSEDSGNEDLGPNFPPMAYGFNGLLSDSVDIEEDFAVGDEEELPVANANGIGAVADAEELVIGAEGGEAEAESGGSEVSTPVRFGGRRPKKKSKLVEQLRVLTTPRPPVDSRLSSDTFDLVPSEVWSRIFTFVDDLSLWCCSRVCKRFAEIVKANANESRWDRFVHSRWPLLGSQQPNGAAAAEAEPVDWFQVYSKLAGETTCLQCLHLTLSIESGDQRRENNWRSKRIMREVTAVQDIDGIEAKALDRRCSQWCASIDGPPGSPYENGKFFLSLKVPVNYPMRPPRVRFLTRIFHPNVSRHGDIGLDILASNWCPALTISKVLLCIQSLLCDPNVDVCMEQKIGELYVTRKSVFDALARCWTWKFAIVDLAHPLTDAQQIDS